MFHLGSAIFKQICCYKFRKMFHRLQNFFANFHGKKVRKVYLIQFHSLGGILNDTFHTALLLRYFREGILSILHRYRRYLGTTARARSHDKTTVSNRRSTLSLHLIVLIDRIKTSISV